MNQLRISFHQLLSKTNIKKLAPVYCTLSLGSATKPLKLSTDIWLSKQDWDIKQKKVNYKHPRYIALNLQLSKMEQRIYSIYDELKKTHEFPSLEMIRRVFRNKTSANYTLLSLYNAFITNIEKRIGSDYVPGTVRHYKCNRNKIQDFLRDVYMLSDIEIKQLNLEFISLFEIFLKDSGNDVNTIHKQTQRLKTVISYGLRNEWFTNNPFKNHQGKTKPTNRKYLTERELKRIEDLSLVGNIEEVRLLFLFICYTGISYSDLFSFRHQDIVVDNEGKRMIDKSRGKTDLNSLIALLKKAEKIMERFKDDPRSIKRGTIFPYKSNKTMNDYLKEIASKASIDKPLSCHIGRHTFATLSLESGIPIETVSKSLGHGDLKTTQIYGKITKAKIDKDYQCASFLR